MPGAFPDLRTGAICQYPLARELAFGTEVVRFLNGSEQRYRTAAAPLRRWVVDVALLDEAETSALKHFFEEQKGRWGEFAFLDPLSGVIYPHCSFESDAFPVVQHAEARNTATLVVYEHA